MAKRGAPRVSSLPRRPISCMAQETDLASRSSMDLVSRRRRFGGPRWCWPWCRAAGCGGAAPWGCSAACA
eukprot:2407316-Prorocentrum_lima.AAC.1